MKYNNENCNRFVEDMNEVGLVVEHYQGRNFWTGPAVRCHDIQDVLSETKIPCQWDQMGLGYIVYPRSSGKLIKQEEVKSET